MRAVPVVRCEPDAGLEVGVPLRQVLGAEVVAVAKRSNKVSQD